MTVRELKQELNKFADNMEIGTADNFGDIEPILSVGLNHREEFVRIDVAPGVRDL